MFTRLYYSSVLEYSIIRPYTNIVYYYYEAIVTLNSLCLSITCDKDDNCFICFLRFCLSEIFLRTVLDLYIKESINFRNSHDVNKSQ